MLQDSALWQAEFPRHPIFRHQVFSHPDWPGFSAQVRASCENMAGRDPQALELQRCIPTVVEAMSASTQAITSLQTANFMALQEQNRALENSLADMRRNGINVSYRFEGTTTGHFGAPVDVPTEADSCSAPGSLANTAIPSAPGTGPALLASASGSHASPTVSTPVQASAAPTGAALLAPLHPPASAGPRVVPRFQMNHTINNVFDLHREFTEGILGRPSVNSVEREWGTAWRKEARTKQYFMRRKKILDEAEWLAAQRHDGDIQAALRQLDQVQRGTRMKSLNALADAIKNGQTRWL